MSVSRSWSAVEIDTAKTCHCETFRNLPRLTLQAPSPTFQFFPVPTTKLSTRLRLLGQVGNWLDLGQTRNRLSSNGGETRETTTAGCTCRGADEPRKTTFDKDSKNWDRNIGIEICRVLVDVTMFEQKYQEDAIALPYYSTTIVQSSTTPFSFPRTKLNHYLFSL